MRLRNRSRVLLVVVLTLVQLGACTMVALVVLADKASASPPLSPLIPHEQQLIAQGMTAAPAAGQPTAPYTVDRVLFDHANLYVQYHPTTPEPLSKSVPADVTISDQAGIPLGAGGGGGCTSARSRWPLRSWLPGAPPEPLVCVQQLSGVGPGPTTVIRVVILSHGLRQADSPPAEVVQVAVPTRIQ